MTERIHSPFQPKQSPSLFADNDVTIQWLPLSGKIVHRANGMVNNEKQRKETGGE